MEIYRKAAWMSRLATLILLLAGSIGCHAFVAPVQPVTLGLPEGCYLQNHQSACFAHEKSQSLQGSIHRPKTWTQRLWSKLSWSLSPPPSRVETLQEESEAHLESIISHYYYSANKFGKRVQYPDLVARLPTEAKKIAKVASVSRWMASMLEGTVVGLIQRRAVDVPPDVQVHALLRGNPAAALFRGKLWTDAKIKMGRIALPAIRMSSGTLLIQQLTLGVWGFLIPSLKYGGPKFPKPFQVVAKDLTFSQGDIHQSPGIRTGLQQLLGQMFQNRGITTPDIIVTSLEVLPCGKITCKGEAKLLFDSCLTFEVRSGVKVSSGGRVLTFPGLEVSLNRDLGLFVPVMTPISVHVGHNARFQKLQIDGTNKLIRICATATITPQHIAHANGRQASNAVHSSTFSVDLGRWLTSLLFSTA